MSAQAGIPSSDAALLLKQSMEQMENDIKAGTVPTDAVFTSLAEVDAYFFSSKQADGAQITGILFRTRVPPYMCFATAPIIPLQSESVRIVNARLPPPPPPSRAPASAQGAMPDPLRSAKADRARKAGDAARAAAAARVAQNPSTPPGAYVPPPPPPSMPVPPAMDDESGVPQG